MKAGSRNPFSFNALSSLHGLQIPQPLQVLTAVWAYSFLLPCPIQSQLFKYCHSFKITSSFLFYQHFSFLRTECSIKRKLCWSTQVQSEKWNHNELWDKGFGIRPWTMMGGAGKWHLVGNKEWDQRVPNVSIWDVHLLLKWKAKGKLVDESIRSCCLCWLWVYSQASGDGPGAATDQGQHLDRRAGLGTGRARTSWTCGTSSSVTAFNHDDVLRVIAAASLPSPKFYTSSSFGQL